MISTIFYLYKSLSGSMTIHSRFQYKFVISSSMHDYPLRHPHLFGCSETTKELLQVLKERSNKSHFLVIYMKIHKREVIFNIKPMVKAGVFVDPTVCMKKPICQHNIHDFLITNRHKRDITVGLDQKIQ